jgi:thiol-disulfide isomerase/thioredoxin
MEPRTRPKWLTWARLWDVLALLVIAFVVWKWFVAPRALDRTNAFPAPRISYTLLDGKTYVLSAHRGHVIFLDFWASWCEPCKVELPLVEAFARQHPEVDVVPVNVGESLPVVTSYANEHHLGNVATDPKSISQGYFQLDGFPTVVVIDPQGRIRATWQGFNPAVTTNMSNAVRELTAKNS